MVQLSYSSSNCYHLALQLLPQRLTSSPFALLSRGERAEVLRFLPMMEVGNRCGVRCFHKSVQRFFSPEVGKVEKDLILVTYAPLPKCRLRFGTFGGAAVNCCPKKGGFAL